MSVEYSRSVFNGEHRLDSFVFSDFASFFDASRNNESESLGRESRTDFDKQWYGTSSFEEACSLAIGGIPEIEASMVKFAEGISLQCGKCTNAISYRFAEVGEEVEIGRYLSGDTDCMLDFSLTEREGGKIISVLLNGSVSWNITSSTIIRRGAAVMALCDLLESAGYRLEITVAFGFCNKNNGDGVAIYVPLKSASDVLDMSRLAYCLAHPSMLRRSVFSFVETLPSSLRRQFSFVGGGSYGRIIDTPICSDGWDIYLGCLTSSDFVSDSQAKDWVLGQLASLDIEIE